MDIFNVFRKRKNEPAEKDDTAHTVSLENAAAWLDEQFGARIKEAEKTVMGMQSALFASLSKTRKVFLSLGESTFEGDSRVSAVTNMTKNSLVTRSVSMIDKMELPEGGDYSTLKDFANKAQKGLEELNKVSPKQAYLLSNYFGDENREISAAMKEAEDKAKEMKGFLETEGRIMQLRERLQNNTSRMLSLLQREKAEKVEASIRAEMSRLEGSKKQEEKRLEGLVSGIEWKEMERSIETLNRQQEEVAKIEADANQVLNTLKRPFKKLQHLAGGRDSFPDNPFREFVANNAEDRLARIIGDAERNAAEGNIRLRPKELKNLKTLKGYVESEVPGLKKRHRILTESSKEMEQMIKKSDLPKKKAEIEEELRRIGEELKIQWSALDSKINERKQSEAEIKELKRKSEKLVREVTGTMLEIKLPAV